MDEVFDLVFDLVKKVVLAQGGDGGGFILSPNYNELADKFHDEWFNERIDYNGSISFSNGQEAVIFAPVGSSTTFADIVIILPYGI